MKKTVEVVLEALHLKNFKGIFDQWFQLNGDTNIFGANETGKSTFLTAFLWLLIGKDEFDRQDFEIKNTKNPELNRQGHEVEGSFKVNDRKITLKRILWEKWVRPKQSSEEIFKGHETEFFINDVQCATAAEFKAKIEEIIPSNILKMITNPMYFNSLDWKDQRRGLIGIAGDVTDDEIFNVIASPKNDYGTLMMVLNSGEYKNVDQYKNEVHAKILKLKQAAIEYPTRIDEAKRNKPEDHDWAAIEKDIADKTDAVEKINVLITDAVKSQKDKHTSINQLRNDLFRKQSELSTLRNSIRLKVEHDQSDTPNKVNSLKLQVKSINDSILRTEKEIENNVANISKYNLEIARLDQIIEAHRTAWSKINAEKFEFDESKCECPTCHQHLPIGTIEEKKQELLKNFNDSVAQRKLEQVNQSNQRKSERIQQQENITRVNAAITDLRDQLTTMKERQQITNNDIDALLQTSRDNPVENVEDTTDELIKKNADAIRLQDEIQQIQSDIETATAALGKEEDHAAEKDQVKQLQSQLEYLKGQLAIKKVIDDANKRIAQLLTEEQATNQEIAKLEQQEFEVESYTRARMDIIEKRVNGMFKYVKFRLFEKQVNGQIVESCVCEYNGVRYPTLNTAAKLLAGLDVLNTLSNHYGIHAPVICDNRESVTWIPESKSQIISLFVSPEDKALRIESATKMKKAS